MTAQLRRQIAEAKTQQERLGAKRKLVANLRQRYGGLDVTTSGPEGAKHGMRFAQLMLEWNPIHFSVEDLKSIAVKPTSETAESLMYTFDHGDVTSSWRFSISGGTITAVEYVPGD